MPRKIVNLADWERWASVIGGALLAGRALRRPPLLNAALAGFGLALIGRGLSGYCPIYHRLGRDQPPWRLGRREERIDTASADSFPASDPPAWTVTSATGAQDR